MTAQDKIFDTRVDTKNIFVSIKCNIRVRSYTNRYGKSLLYLFITGNGDRERISLDIYIYKSEFCPKKQRLIGNDDKSKDINLILDNIDSKITSIKTIFRLSNKFLDVVTFKNEFINGIPRINFISFCKRYLEDEKGRIGDGTYKRYLSVIAKLERFKSSILFTEIDNKFIFRLRNAFSALGNENTTIEGNIAAVKKFLNAAKNMGIQLSLDPDTIKIGNTNGNRVDLKPTEVKKLYKYFMSEFINPTNRIILGYFLFSCFNGNRISEIQQLKREEFTDSFVVYHDKKNNKLRRKKINDTTLNILKHEEQLFVTKFTDEYMNRELKKIVKLCGITKKVTFHTGRHTFATNFLRMGGDVITLKNLLGHSKIETTLIYVHIVEQETNDKVFLIDNLIQ